ncbi:TPA: NusA-like transcription termination signal-binding factor [Candidatus Micrarchaeota archaeon]|nr:NusA-like transcription termination signal-binding factor [Candidatus Micrarchaeota archaeon]
MIWFIMPTLSLEDIQLINFIEMSTGAKANDLVRDENALIIVVQKGELGKAIGKAGANVQKLRQKTGKEIVVIEDSDDAKAFLANVLAPAVLRNVAVSENGGKKVAIVDVDSKNRGGAIGRGGEKIKRARLLLQRKFGFDDVKLR